MESVRHYSTIGIEGFVCGPSHPLPPNYLGDSPQASSFASWEINGKIKEKPEDFVVREILPKDRFSKLWSHYASRVTNESSKGDGHPLNMATLPSIPPITLPSDEPPNQSKGNASGATDEPPTKKTIVGDQIHSSKDATKVSESSSGNASAPTEVSMENTFQMYIEAVATTEHPASALQKSLEALNEKAIHRIPAGQIDTTTTTATENSTAHCKGDECIDATTVWIPPLYLQTDTNGTENGGPTTEIEMKAQRKAFHKAIRILYPFLKTESAPSPNKGKTTGDHWIKIHIDHSFDGLIPYLYTPRDELRQLFLFRNWGFEGAPSSSNETKSESSVILKLRPGVSKDDRRNVHHILAQKNKHFESSIRHQGSKNKPNKIEEKSENIAEEKTPPATTDLIVSWKKQAFRKGFKNKKRKRSEGHPSDHLLCVLKKTQKEHLTVMQMLSRSLRCKQGDIGFAGIKDMQAITYQFVTLRNMGRHKAERCIRQNLQSRDVELKILCTNVDFVLNVGDLEGNQFEITVRDLKRIKVDQIMQPNNGSLESAKESFVDCDREHFEQMVDRIKQHGFINFYGEQRTGIPGTSEEVGVRPFEIGRAMLGQDFKKAIDLIMEGKRHNETDEVRKVRQAWKDSNGNPSVTLKAFGKADILPRERAILRGLNRYPDNPLEAIRFLAYNMRIFYIHAYQSLLFNKVASRRVKLYGNTVVKGDLYFEKDQGHRDDIKVVQGNEDPPIEISQVVLPLPGYNIQYPTNEIGQFYRELMENDGVKFEKDAVPEATANGSYRKLIVHPRNLSAETDSSCGSMKLSFQLPKGSYATMLLRELMLTTVVRSQS